jgi:hypothetical protein
MYRFIRWRRQVVLAALCGCLGFPHCVSAANISPLGWRPHWSILEKYQETITHDEFVHLLQDVYCTHGMPENMIQVGPDSARILCDKEKQSFFILHFARDDASRKRIPRWWRPAAALGAAKSERPISGVQIALDPGHLGGRWAKMEERWFQVDDSKPVKEGDMTLRVTRLLAPCLRKLGASVSFVRNHTRPATPKRPDDFVALARKILKGSIPSEDKAVEDYDQLTRSEKRRLVRHESELLFYRRSEIRHRALRVNGKLEPDLVLCLHFNAESWGDSNSPTLVDLNHLHLLVNGSYLESELEFDDQRFEMLRKLLSRSYDQALPIADKCAEVMAKETGLPRYQYPTTQTTTRVGTSGYVYARNLMATRLYRCPVVYFEPYVMNGKDAFARIQAGDYEGVKKVNGIERKSIYREYADSVADGLADYYRAARRKAD